jgi:2'-5' RNA ligase
MRGVPHALELLLDPELEHRVRGAWEVLAAAGLPSQALHPHPTNRPHVTLAVTEESADDPADDPTDDPADGVPDAVRAALAVELAALPLTVCLDGVVVLGGRRRTVAWLVVPSAPLLRLHRDVHRAVHGAARADASGPPLLRPDRWVPHVTLAARVTSEQAAAVVAALGGLPAATGTADAVRSYDLVARTTTTLHPRPAPGARAL